MRLVLVWSPHGALVIRAGACILVILLEIRRRLVGSPCISATLAFEGFGSGCLVLGLVGSSIFSLIRHVRIPSFHEGGALGVGRSS